MQIKISGKQIDVGAALRTHVEDNMVAAVGKYFDRPVDAHVVFSRNGHEFKCDSSVHLSTGLTAQAHAVNGEIYAAFEQATDRIEKQLRRYKRRLKDHHHSRQDPIEALYWLSLAAEQGHGAVLKELALATMTLEQLAEVRRKVSEYKQSHSNEDLLAGVETR